MFHAGDGGLTLTLRETRISALLFLIASRQAVRAVWPFGSRSLAHRWIGTRACLRAFKNVVNAVASAPVGKVACFSRILIRM
jgi:hypothetical protein